MRTLSLATLSFATLAMLFVSTQANAMFCEKTNKGILCDTGQYVEGKKSKVDRYINENGVIVVDDVNGGTGASRDAAKNGSSDSQSGTKIVRDANGNSYVVGTGSARLDESCVRYLMNSGKASDAAIRSCSGGGSNMNGDNHEQAGLNDCSGGGCGVDMSGVRDAWGGFKDGVSDFFDGDSSKTTPSNRENHWEGHDDPSETSPTRDNHWEGHDDPSRNGGTGTNGSDQGANAGTGSSTGPGGSDQNNDGQPDGHDTSGVH